MRVDEEQGRTVLTAPDFAATSSSTRSATSPPNPRAGLLFVDLTSGDLLALTGAAEVLWDGAELDAFAGAQRLLRLRVDEGRWWPGIVPLRAGAVEFAAQLAETGSWAAAASGVGVMRRPS